MFLYYWQPPAEPKQEVLLWEDIKWYTHESGPGPDDAATLTSCLNVHLLAKVLWLMLRTRKRQPERHSSRHFRRRRRRVGCFGFTFVRRRRCIISLYACRCCQSRFRSANVDAACAVRLQVELTSSLLTPAVGEHHFYVFQVWPARPQPHGHPPRHLFRHFLCHR